MPNLPRTQIKTNEYKQKLGLELTLDVGGWCQWKWWWYSTSPDAVMTFHMIECINSWHFAMHCNGDDGEGGEGFWSTFINTPCWSSVSQINPRKLQRIPTNCKEIKEITKKSKKIAKKSKNFYRLTLLIIHQFPIIDLHQTFLWAA